MRALRECLTPWLIVALLVSTSFTGCGRTDPGTATGGRDMNSRPAQVAAESQVRLQYLPSNGAPHQLLVDQGQGPGMGGDRFASLNENPFTRVGDQPLSTFSIDVDTASYAKARMYLLEKGCLPPSDAVRVEEFINYFEYDYSTPTGDDPIAVSIESAAAPWQPAHRLLRLALKARDLQQERPACNVVFLLDVSGSMGYTNKLPLVKQGLRLLADQLGPRDRVSIVVYAGAAGLVLPPTPGDQAGEIKAALDALEAGGSTNGGQGIHLAYHAAQENFIPGGVNRVLLCTDGDFNVGTTSPGELVRLAQEYASDGVFLSVLGFGMGNHNDAMLEELSNKANGNYAFIDNEREARKVLGDQLDSTLVTVAKDVKVQIEFNPAHVAAYRLIGYENRLLAAEDFNDDRKDAGEVGAGHRVTALYELVPVGATPDSERPAVDPLKYQADRPLADAADSAELLTVKVRYKLPEANESHLMSVPFADAGADFVRATRDFQFAAAVAAFGMLLRDSPYRGDISYEAVREIAGSALGTDQHGHRSEFIEMVDAAKGMSDVES